MTKLFIGMPVYNGERFISLAIESLRNQSFTDWKLLISDNCSEDGTQGICEKYCDLDSRITYFRQKQNRGAPANFKFPLDRAESPYFMWAAADDFWHEDFLATCIGLLEKNREAGFAFCSIVNIDTFGRTIRSYPDFRRFTGDDRKNSVAAYVAEPEILGKANIIYSIYRTDVCKKAWARSPLTEGWGSDMCFILAALARSPLVVDEKVLFYKRIVRNDDTPGQAHEIVIENPKKYVFPFYYSVQYLVNNLRAVEKTEFFLTTLIIMSGRVFGVAAVRIIHYPFALGKRLFKFVR
jgi:glycosyltransferase involved in cell wall biosynthesis